MRGSGLKIRGWGLAVPAVMDGCAGCAARGSERGWRPDRNCAVLDGWHAGRSRGPVVPAQHADRSWGPAHPPLRSSGFGWAARGSELGDAGSRGMIRVEANKDRWAPTQGQGTPGPNRKSAGRRPPGPDTKSAGARHKRRQIASTRPNTDRRYLEKNLGNGPPGPDADPILSGPDAIPTQRAPGPDARLAPMQGTPSADLKCRAPTQRAPGPDTKRRARRRVPTQSAGPRQSSRPKERRALRRRAGS